MKVVSLLLALWMQVPATVNAPIIDDVAIRGNRRIQSTTIKYYIQSRRGETVNRALVSRDIRAIYAREQFRNHSVISAVAVGCIAGLGWRSYSCGLQSLIDILRERQGK